MEKDALLGAIERTHADAFGLIEELGIDGLERPGVVGEWSVRDVLAHCNCWDRWQIVQLRCAFTGETPSDDELRGPIVFPPNDDMHEDAMNAMFIAGYEGWATKDVVVHFREVCGMREDWVGAASQDQLDAIVGSDWTGGTNRIIRLASEVEQLTGPLAASQFVMNQVDHLGTHLGEIRSALSRK
jgi:hypothetical protein